MINFIKSIIPNLIGYVGFFFKGVSTFFLYISFTLHKLLRTELGLKIIKMETKMKEMKAVFNQMQKSLTKPSNGASKGKSIISQDANPKLAQIIGSDDE